MTSDLRGSRAAMPRSHRRRLARGVRLGLWIAALASARPCALAAPPPPPAVAQTPMDRWWPVAEKAGVAFWAELAERPADQVLGAYVGRLAKADARDAYRWAMAAPDVLVPYQQAHPVRLDGREPDGDRRRLKRMIREAQLAAARCEVELFLKDTKAFEQYYRLMLWGGVLFGTEANHSTAFTLRIERCAAGLAEDDAGDERYWYAREFFLLAHATGRDDLLKGLTAENLPARFAAWRAWLTNGQAAAIRHLIVRRPNRLVWTFDAGRLNDGDLPSLMPGPLPGADWDGDVPPSLFDVDAAHLGSSEIRAATLKAAGGQGRGVEKVPSTAPRPTSWPQE